MNFTLHSAQILGMFQDFMSGIGESLSNFFNGFWGIIGKAFYYLFLGLCKVLDVCQILFYKFAGLDSVYMKGEEIQGDLLLTFINSSVVQNVFFSLLILSVVLLFATTFIAVLKNEFQPLKDGKTSKGKIIGLALRSLVNFLAVPVLTVLGLIIANGLLGSLAAATSGGTDVTLSRQIFYTAAYSANRARTNFENFNDDLNGFSYNVATYAHDVEGDFYYESPTGQYYFIQTSGGTYIFDGEHYVPKTALSPAPFYFRMPINASSEQGINNFGIFFDDSNSGILTSSAADKIDAAFLNDLAIPDGYQFINNDYVYMTINDVPVAGSEKDQYFSIYNTNLVYFYYDLTLSGFDYIIGYVGVVFLAYVFFTTTVGLIRRLFECVTLFMISPVAVAMGPLDEKQNGYLDRWRKQFVKTALNAYSFIVVMNCFLILLPLINQIEIFPSTVAAGSVGIGGLLSSIKLSLLNVTSSPGFGKELINRITRLIIMIAGAVFFKDVSGKVADIFQLDDLAKIGSESFGKVAKGANAVVGGLAGGVLGAAKLPGRLIEGGKNLVGAPLKFLNDPRKFKDKATDVLMGKKDETGKRAGFLNTLGGNIKKVGEPLLRPAAGLLNTATAINDPKSGIGSTFRTMRDGASFTAAKKEDKGGKGGDKGGKGGGGDKGGDNEEKAKTKSWGDFANDRRKESGAKQKELQELRKAQKSGKSGLSDQEYEAKQNQLKAERRSLNKEAKQYDHLSSSNVSVDAKVNTLGKSYSGAVTKAQGENQKIQDNFKADQNLMKVGALMAQDYEQEILAKRIGDQINSKTTRKRKK